MTSSCLVIIPALNEELSVGMVVRRTVESGFSCLVVDDGSRDNTADVARRAGAHVVTMPINLGVVFVGQSPTATTQLCSVMQTVSIHQSSSPN